MTARRGDIITLLERFGLSTYEAKAYLAAVGQAPLTAYKLARLSGVPRPRIYEIVDRLLAKGLLIFQSGGRTLLAAASYEKVLSQKEAENREMIDRLRKLLSAVPSAESPGIWNISGRDQVLHTARSLLEAARRYVYLESMAEDVHELLTALQKVRQRKVALYGIYCGDLPSGSAGLIRHLGEICLSGCEIAVVVDGEQALIGCTQPPDSASAALTQNTGLINITREYIRHEVFLNSLFGRKDKAVAESYVRRYRSLMRRLP
jgi:predicted transcriptional regulator